MEVIGAGFTANDMGWVSDRHIRLSGEITYEGMLICLYERSPVNDEDDLILLPDPTKDIMIPITHKVDYYDNEGKKFRNFNGSLFFGDTFIHMDSNEINIGSKDELSYKFGIDFNKLFAKDPKQEIMRSYKKAKATIRNINIEDIFTTAELVDIEIVE